MQLAVRENTEFSLILIPVVGGWGEECGFEVWVVGAQCGVRGFGVWSEGCGVRGLGCRSLVQGWRFGL